MRKAAGDEQGSASVEFALVLPVLVLVLAWCLGAAAWALQAAQAQRAAAEGARVAITGSDAAALAATARLGGQRAHVSRDGQVVTVCVPVPARMALPAGQRCASAWDRP